MTKKEIEKLSKLFKESCISAWTSERFQIPAMTKTEAEIRWLEISVLFASAVYELLEDKKKKRVNKMKQIKIEELIPFVREGWVAMNRDESWRWFNSKPSMESCYWAPEDDIFCEIDATAFNIAPAEDWTKSLIKIERK